MPVPYRLSYHLLPSFFLCASVRKLILNHQSQQEICRMGDNPSKKAFSAFLNSGFHRSNWWVSRILLLSFFLFSHKDTKTRRKNNSLCREQACLFPTGFPIIYCRLFSSVPPCLRAKNILNPHSKTKPEARPRPSWQAPLRPKSTGNKIPIFPDLIFQLFVVPAGLSMEDTVPAAAHWTDRTSKPRRKQPG